jgi:hypothetical protein
MDRRAVGSRSGAPAAVSFIGDAGLGSRKDLRRTESRLEVAFGVRLSLAAKKEGASRGTQLDQLAVIFWGPGSIALRGHSSSKVVREYAWQGVWAPLETQARISFSI